MRGCIILMLIFGSIYGKSQSEAFRNYSDNDGLPGNSVYAVQQDSRGEIWISTEKGVSRFDGSRFLNLTTDNGLADNEIFKVYEDHLRRVWFISYNGMLSFSHNGKIVNGSDFPFLNRVKPRGMGLDMLEDDSGNLWYVASTAVYKYGINGQLDSIVFNDDESPGFISVFPFGEDMFIFSGAGIYSWNKKKFLYSDDISRFNLVPNSKVALAGNTLFFSLYEQIFRMRLDTSRSSVDTFHVFKASVQALQYNGNNQLWISTSKGAHLLNINTGVITRTIMKDEPVSWVMTDRENILWVATLGSGVFYSANPRIMKYDVTDGLSQNRVFTFRLLPGGNLLAGHEKFKATLINKNHVTYFNPAFEDFRRGRIYSILVESKNSVWLVSEKIIHLSLYGTSFKADYINYSSKDMVKGMKPGEYFIAGSKGLSFLDMNKLKEVVPGKWEGLHLFPYPLRLSALCLDSARGKLYMGGSSGLFYFDLNEKNIHPVQLNRQVYTKPVTRLIRFNDEFLAFTTAMDGLYLFNEQKVIHINKEKGLINNICNSLHIDSLNNLWVATADGVNKIEFAENGNMEDFRIKSFTKEHGLISREIFDVATSGDKVFAASANGICIFQEKNITKNNIPPLLHLDEFSISGLRLDPGKKNVLRSDQNHVRVAFTSVSFRSNGNMTYRYKMEGIDKKWQLTHISDIEYPYLPPGDYTFFLSASNGDGVYTDPPLKIEFTIRESFYSTWWFYTVIGFLVLFIITFFIYSWFRRIAEKHLVEQRTLQLERDHAETERKMIELEHMALRLHMNPHFVFNAINTIQGFYAANDILRAKSYISKFSRLIRSIMDTSREQQVPLGEEIGLLKNYLELCALRMEYPFSYEIAWDESIDPDNCEISPMLVQPFVENAILHGISPLKGGGHIIICFSKQDNYLECAVEDNGIGREKSAKLNLGKLHKSSGIRVTQERISLINKGALLDTNVKIIDLYDDEMNPAGTRVIFRTPLFSEPG